MTAAPTATPVAQVRVMESLVDTSFAQEALVAEPEGGGSARPIVVGVDGSESAERALGWARDAAQLRALTLRVIFAAADPRAIVPSLPPDTEIVRDSPASALIKASDEASLVVVGHRGHGGFHDLLVGSTSMHTAMHARCPVAIVRPFSTEPADPESLHAVVVGVDGAESSDSALEYAFTEADLTARTLLAIHAWQGDITAGAMGMPYVYDPIDRHAQAEQLLTETLNPWRERFPDVDVRTLVLQLPASAALVQHSYGAHLTVAGSRGLGGFSGMLLGSVGQALIHHAGSPVVIAR